jgi:hypothetical protein
MARRSSSTPLPSFRQVLHDLRHPPTPDQLAKRFLKQSLPPEFRHLVELARRGFGKFVKIPFERTKLA